MAPDESWTLQPPYDHSVAWGFVYRGEALINGAPVGNELVVLEPGDGDLRVKAVEPCRLLVGSAALHNHRLVLGSHLVHTCQQALARGGEGITRVGQELRASGRV